MHISRFAQAWIATPSPPLVELGGAVRGWSLRMFADHVSWQTTLTLMSGRGGLRICITGRTLLELLESTGLPNSVMAKRHRPSGGLFSRLPKRVAI